MQCACSLENTCTSDIDVISEKFQNADCVGYLHKMHFSYTFLVAIRSIGLYVHSQDMVALMEEMVQNMSGTQVQSVLVEITPPQTINICFYLKILSTVF